MIVVYEDNKGHGQSRILHSLTVNIIHRTLDKL